MQMLGAKGGDNQAPQPKPQTRPKSTEIYSANEKQEFADDDIPFRGGE